ncbi:hypothetical protein AMTR_s00157p00065740 [Amborella trichopoda]|uniref:Aminotransferase-like plant mobile domain-containing protein n=1 Tax=Amborella trichopoda TaxID=13333 RepID=W1PCG2_AMBTC|nr:hypothetical protein AMTR_s00157p00065740 [Amborella trichopoda]
MASQANFRELPPDATVVEVVRYTRAYLLFLVSVTIFVDASVSTVPIRYLQFFKDIEEVCRYAWGAAALVICDPYFKPDEVISDDRQQAYQIAMCIMTLIFDNIVESYMSDHKFQYWLTRYDQMMHDIEEDTVNGLPSEEYKAWYNLVSHPIIHNVTNSPKDILQPHNQEKKDMVPAHEPQYIMRPRSYENQLVNAVQASTIMLIEALTLRVKWYPEVYNRVNDAFETLSKFVPVDMDDVEARMEDLQRVYNDKSIPNEVRHDVVSESSQGAKDLASSTKSTIEERKRYNTRKKQYQPKRRRPM